MPLEAPPIPQPVAPAPIAGQRGFAPRPARFAADRAGTGWRSLRRLFWVLFAGLNIAVLSKVTAQTFPSVIGAQCILAAAMLPSYLWISGRVRGLPLFPAYALTCVWTFGLPLISENPVVSLFPGWNQLVAAFSVTAFLLIATAAWYPVARRPSRPPAVCWAMNEAQSVPSLLLVLGLCGVWTMFFNAGLIRLPSGLDSLSRAILIALQSLSCFVISFRLGSGKLSLPMTVTFYVETAVLLVAAMPSLLLIYAMSMVGVALLAYVVASKRLPWHVGLALLCLFGFLHLGKAKMRDKYWDEDYGELRAVSVRQYPEFYGNWIQCSMDSIREGSATDEASASLLERASLMHLMLYFQAVTPVGIPYMYGETYAVIPRMIVPRMFDANKPRSNEANFLLAIHYGMQTREDTDTTTFAFGLINEAYANFGFAGMGVMAVLLGYFYGKVAYWARQMPILSFRALFAVLVASYSFQAEFSSTYYVAALFQSTMVLIAVSVVAMRRHPRTGGQASLLD